MKPIGKEYEDSPSIRLWSLLAMTNLSSPLKAFLVCFIKAIDLRKGSFSIVLGLMLIIVPSGLVGVIEFITEDVAGVANSYLFIPYSDFFSQKDGEHTIINNYLSISILSEKDDIVYQEQQQIRLPIDRPLAEDINQFNLMNEYYPLRFQTQLASGSYRLIVLLSAVKTGQKRDYRRQFNFRKQDKDIGNPFLIAHLDGTRFVIRDREMLKNRFDGVELWQSVSFEPEQTMVAITQDGDKTYVDKNELETIAAHITPDSPFTISIVNQTEDITYHSELVYPNTGYFYGQRYTPPQQLAQLRNVINQNEYQMLSNIEDDKLQEAIDDYWDSIDPDTYSVDNFYRRTFYSRVLYADRNYSIPGYLAGWQTDRGKIYLKYGGPDSVVSDNFPIGRKPSITWHYYSINRSFTFYDLRGYGNYELEDKWID